MTTKRTTTTAKRTTTTSELSRGGRPPKGPADRLSTRVPLLVREADRELLERAWRGAHYGSLSEWARGVLLRAARDLALERLGKRRTT